MFGNLHKKMYVKCVWKHPGCVGVYIRVGVHIRGSVGYIHWSRIHTKHKDTYIYSGGSANRRSHKKKKGRTGICIFNVLQKKKIYACRIDTKNIDACPIHKHFYSCPHKQSILIISMPSLSIQRISMPALQIKCLCAHTHKAYQWLPSIRTSIRDRHRNAPQHSHTA